MELSILPDMPAHPTTFNVCINVSELLIIWIHREELKQSILLIGHKSFVGNDIKKTILKEDKFNIFYLDKYFKESDIISLNTKEFCEKYF